MPQLCSDFCPRWFACLYTVVAAILSGGYYCSTCYIMQTMSFPHLLWL